MPTRCNKHIKKFNQLVQVYDPSGVSEMDLVDTRKESGIRERKAEVEERIREVNDLTVSTFFDEEERAVIEDNDSLAGPESVADNQRAEMLARLEEMQHALDTALEETAGLDASDDLTL